MFEFNNYFFYERVGTNLDAFYTKPNNTKGYSIIYPFIRQLFYNKNRFRPNIETFNAIWVQHYMLLSLPIILYL